MDTTEERYLTTKETCEHLQVSRQTLTSYVRHERLKRYKKKGRRSYYKEQEVLSLTQYRED